MIKECSVLRTNDYVTVVKFGDIKVQLPSIKNDAKMIHVAHEDGKYFVVTDNYKKEITKTRNETNTKKVSTIHKLEVIDPVEVLAEQPIDSEA